MSNSSPPPKGIKPLFLRGVTLEKYGMKIGESINDLVDNKSIPKADIMKEIQVMGVMSDFEPAKKEIESYPGDLILVIVDKTQQYGETFLLVYTEEAKDEMMKSVLEAQEALRAQLEEEERLEAEKKAAEEARRNVVYEDKPLSPRPWKSSAMVETEQEVKILTHQPTRDLISIEIIRPKKFQKAKYRFTERNADIGGVAEFKAYKDPNFKQIREIDRGIQVAPLMAEGEAQTAYYRSVNKSIQYESSSSTSVGTDSTSGTGMLGEITDSLLTFLEKATVRIEKALQQNESVDIFHDTFRLLGDEDGQEGAQNESELRYLKNFADANFSKNKALAAIDWMPKAQGMVAVSAVRNISFDQRIPTLGQTDFSYVMLWDFRLLVKPLILMQSHHEVFTFRYNSTDPNFVVGGCITGQVILWEVGGAINNALGKNSKSSGNSKNQFDDDEEQPQQAVVPKYVSNVDYSHKKCVADLFWLPPNRQINYRGQLVGEEHLDGHSYQFVTVAGDGLIMVWDTRFERIFNDELRHIAKAKHVPTEKTSNKENGVKPLWAPIFRAHLKRLEGVGELSLCKVCDIANPHASTLTIGKPSNFSGDYRSQFIIATEEGDIIFADVGARKAEGAAGAGHKEEEEEDDSEVSCVRWINNDHSRPCVHLQESPFFPQIVLSVSDWNFHIWKLGENKPLFSSPLSTSYLTTGCWSNTRPSVLLIACADGHILVWDFTDSSYRQSLQLKAAPFKITSMELLSSTTARHQLLAVGDEAGTLHIHELPRNVTKPVHREEAIMHKFLERELQRVQLGKVSEDEVETLVGSEIHSHHAHHHQDNTNRPAADAQGQPTTTVPPEQLAELSAKAADAALAKDEEDFLKLESIFIAEMGLGPVPSASPVK